MAESRQSPNGWLRKAQTDLGAAQELHGRAEYSAIVCFVVGFVPHQTCKHGRAP
jgi:hypothetical protein